MDLYKNMNNNNNNKKIHKQTHMQILLISNTQEIILYHYSIFLLNNYSATNLYNIH